MRLYYVFAAFYFRGIMTPKTAWHIVYRFIVENRFYPFSLIHFNTNITSFLIFYIAIQCRYFGKPVSIKRSIVHI